MSGLIELVFEGLSADDACKILYKIIEPKNVLEVTSTEWGVLEYCQLPKILVNSLENRSAPASIFVKAESASVGEVCLSKPLLRLLSFEGLCDFAIIFEASDIFGTSRDEAAMKLSEGARLLVADVTLHDYYCGIEPATDEETRFFSSKDFGPLHKF
ncbi:hypothetical protein [Acidovorax sacchari]|uniref:hypothetical protein n=1 Tax=Acidovorax sacchari TaxID=3230736 RepID=UPI0039E5B4CC